MSSCSIKYIDLEGGAVDRNLLESRKYGTTMKINAAGKQSNGKCEEMQSPFKWQWREMWNRALKGVGWTRHLHCKNEAASKQAGTN